MDAPTQENIRESISRLESSLPLFQQDIIHLAWGFAFHPDQNSLLREIGAHNKKLAETLLIFRRALRQATASMPPDLEPAIDRIHLHYVINTNGPIPEGAGEDPFDVFRAAARYGHSLCVEVAGDAEQSVLRVNETEKAGPGWSIVPDRSAAWSLRAAAPAINRVRYDRDDVIPSAVLGFDENTAGYTLHYAMTLADFSHLAYFSRDYVEKQVRQWGYDAFAWINNPDTDTQAFLAGKDGHLMLCFRGTSSGADALVDLRLLKTDAFGGRGRVHSGFQKALNSVWDEVQAATDALGAGKKLFISGHSLGAALAQLAAHRLALGGYPVTGVYVYGSPRVGNRDFKATYDELLMDKTFLHINDGDIVTRVPPQVLGFYHLGGPPRVFDEGHTIRMGDAEQTPVPEQDFDGMDAATRQAIQEQTEAAQAALEAYTRFLEKAPENFQAFSYATQFEDGAVDNHGKDQYLFKLGCAIVDSEWARLTLPGERQTNL